MLGNIGSTYNDDGNLFWEGQVVQWSFNLLLICHIPFIFFFGKEGLLIIIDELDRKSISNALFLKLQNNTYFEHKTDGLAPPNEDLRIPGDEATPNFKDVLDTLKRQNMTKSQDLQQS